jgi:hypothetical protein
MGDVEAKVIRIPDILDFGLTIFLVTKADFCRWQPKIAAQNVSQSRAALNKTHAIAEKVKSPSTGDLVRGKNV